MKIEDYTNNRMTLSDLLEPTLLELGYEFIGCTLHKQGKRSLLRVYIDSQQCIGIADCERASRQLSALLDVADPIVGEYLLEVSSPGIERPLFTVKHFCRFKGHLVKITLHSLLDGKRRYKGIIQDVTDDRVCLLIDDGQQVQFSINDIAKANLIAE